MNWKKVLLIAVAGGIVTWLYNFLMHGVIMSSTYTGNPLFIQEGNPVWFLLVEVSTGFTGALLFVKTRSVWADGPKGGATFGFFIGLVAFFPMFISPLVISGFPYYLAWCWGAIALFGWLLWGVVAGLIHKQA